MKYIREPQRMVVNEKQKHNRKSQRTVAGEKQKQKRQPRQMAVDEKQLRDFSRRDNAKRHKRRHKRNYILYYIILIFLLLVTFVTLSFTVLFNIQNVTVTANQLGLTQSVIDGTGVKIGDNLLRINTKSIEKKILAKNMQLDSVKVKRKFPNTLHIELGIGKTELIIKANNKYYYLSEGGRLIKISDTNDEPDVIQFAGMKMDNMKLGDYINSSKDENYQTCKTILEAIEQSKIEHITNVSLKDSSCIRLYYENRLEIKVGNIQELTYRLNVAREVISKLDTTDKGIVDVQIDGKAYFKPEAEITLP